MISPAIFMVMNNSLTRGALLNRKLILGSPVVEVKNSTVPIEERFDDIPADNINVTNLLTKKGCKTRCLKTNLIRQGTHSLVYLTKLLISNLNKGILQ